MSKYILILVCFCIVQQELAAQLDTVHYLPPMHSRSNGNIEDHYVYLATPETTPFQVTVTDGSGAVFPGSPFTLSNASPVVISVGTGQVPSTKLVVGFNDLNKPLADKGLIFSAPQSFFVNARYRAFYHAEAITCKGRAAAGTSFRVGMMPIASGNGIRNFVVGFMALEDGTQIEISEYDTEVVFNGVFPVVADELLLSLNAGECYVLSGYSETAANLAGFIGALVESNKPIVINAGNMLGTLGPGNEGQDMAFDQIVPDAKIGNHYVAIEGQGVPGQERPMVVAHYDGTQVFINGSSTPIAVLNAGGYFLINNSYYTGVSHRNMYIYATEPVSVYQFLAGTNTATPGMNFLPPVDCSLPNAVDLVPFVEQIGSTIYIGGIFAITQSGSTLTLNGTVQSGAEPVGGNPGWESYKILGLTGNVSVASTGGLAVGILGQSGAAGFSGYYAGFSSVLDVVVNKDTSFCVGSNNPVDLLAEANGGFPPYTFEWSQGLGSGAEHTVNPLSTTQYVVTVTDAVNCTSTDKIIISIHDLPDVDLSPDSELCNGDSTLIEVNINNGNGPFTYNWSEGLGDEPAHWVSPEAFTQYTVNVVDDNGCENSGSIEIGVNDLPTTSISGDDFICDGENSVLTASGDFNTYEWSNGGSGQSVAATTNGAHLVTVTDDNGCKNTATFLLEVSPSPVVVLGPDESICLGDTITISGQVFGGEAPLEYTWDNGFGDEPEITVNPVTKSTYTLSVEDDFGCKGYDAITIDVNEGTSLNISGDTELCAGFESQLDAGDAFESYAWSTGDTSQTITVSTSGVYSITATDGEGCLSLDSLELVVSDSLQPLISGNLSICSGQNSILDVGANYADFIWSTGDTSQTILVDGAGTYAVTVTNSTGCSGSIEVQTDTFEAPVLDLVQNINLCLGDSLNLSINSSLGEPPYNYLWNQGDSLGNSIALLPAMDSTYSVTVTDGNNCIDSASVFINVHELPVVLASNDQNLCFGDSLFLNAQASLGTPPYNFQWNNGVGVGPAHGLLPDSNGTYIVAITDSIGCVSMDSLEVNIGEEIISNITGDSLICIGNTSELSVSNVYTDYLWSTGDTTAIVFADQAGVYSVTITDDLFCEAVASFELLVIDSLTPQILSDTSFCSGDSLTLSVDDNYPIYQWSTGETSTTINIYTAGPYSIMVENNEGCAGTDDIYIYALETPSISTNPTEVICEGEEVLLMASGNLGEEPYEFAWDNGLGLGSDHIVNPNVNTTYQVTITDNNGCSSTSTVMVEVKANPTAELEAQESLCENDVLELSFNGSIDPDNNFIWDFGQANIVSGTGAGPYILEFDNAGNYSISLILDLNGCKDTSTINIDVNPISSSASIIDACDAYIWNGNEYTISGNYTFETDNMFGCDSVASLSLEIHSSYDTIIENMVCEESEVGIEEYNLLTAFGCDSLITEVNLLGEDISVSLGEDMLVPFGTEIDLEALIIGNLDIIASISWEGIVDPDCPTCLVQSFSAEDSALVTIYIEDINGCVYSDALLISVLHSDELYAPNIFSPNNDGINDLFYLQGNSNRIKNIQALHIYDRWGNLLFEEKNLPLNSEGASWDGTFNGKVINPGVFVWHAEIELDDGKIVHQQGDVTLIR